jgi:predicted extracellular nuclease
VVAIQDTSDPNHPSVGTRVRIGCIITAVSSNSVWCQEASGGPYSGIAIFAGSAPSYVNNSKAIQIGDNVTIDGDYAEFFDVTQLENPEISFLNSGAIPTPITLSASLLATGSSSAEMYEGVLVRVANVTVTNVNPDAPSDYDEFAVTGGLRIDDMIIDGGGTGGALDNTYALGTPFSSIVGILHYSFNDYKLLPRSAADITP